MIELILTMEVNFSHLAHKEMEAQHGLSNLPRVSQLVRVEAGFEPRTERVTWAFNKQLFRACQGHTMLCTWPCAPPGPGILSCCSGTRPVMSQGEGEACPRRRAMGADPWACGPRAALWAITLQGDSPWSCPSELPWLLGVSRDRPLGLTLSGPSCCLHLPGAALGSPAAPWGSFQETSPGKP